MVCDKCKQRSSVYEPSLVLSLSLRSDSKNKVDTPSEEVIFFKQPDLDKMESYDVPVNCSSQKVYDVLRLMQRISGSPNCAMFIADKQSIIPVRDDADFSYAQSLKKTDKNNRIVVIGYESSFSDVPQIAVPFKLRWINEFPPKKTMHSDFCLPLILTTYNHSGIINNLIRNMEDHINEWNQRENRQHATVEVGLYSLDNYSNDICVVCGRVDCFGCFYQDKDKLEEYLETKFREQDSNRNLMSMTTMELDSERPEPRPNLRIIFRVTPDPFNLDQPKLRYLPAMEDESKRIERIEDLLSLFSSTETLTNEDKITCGKCHLKECSQKSTKLVHLPQILILHIKRFKFSETQGFTKNNQQIDFDFFLDLAPYYDSHPGQDPNNDDECSEKKQAKFKVSTRYKLKAVVNHQGSLHGGHYFAYVEENGDWREYNDEITSSLHSSEISSNKAYILFYERC